MKQHRAGVTDKAISPRFAIRMDWSDFVDEEALATEAFPRFVNAAIVVFWAMRKRPTAPFLCP